MCDQRALDAQADHSNHAKRSGTRRFAPRQRASTEIERCVRILLHVASDRSKAAVNHVYLHDAVKLRPDIANG